MTSAESIKALLEKHREKKDLHITRGMCAWVVVSGGRVVDIDASGALNSCPLQRMLSKSGIEDYANEKIREFGHFTARRRIARSDIAVPYGTSEMFMWAMRKGVLDCAVTVCDGAGTVVSSDPAIVQGIGARMNGLFYTTPISEVLGGLRREGCTVFDDARIDQLRGLMAAIDAGHRKIAVSVNLCCGESLPEIRRIEREAGVSVLIAGICSTGAEKARAEEAVANADIAWSCASAYMRGESRGALLQITTGIPIFVYTRKGLDLVAAYSDSAGSELIRGLDPARQHLLSSAHGGTRMKLGGNQLWLREEKLPVSGKHEPAPLR